MAVLFIGTVIAVAVSIADQRLDAIATGAPEQTPETSQVSGDAVGFVGAAQAVGFSVANGGFRNTVWSIQFPHTFELEFSANGSLLSFHNF